MTYEEFKKKITEDQDLKDFLNDENDIDPLVSFYDAGYMLADISGNLYEGAFNYENFTQNDGEGMVTTYINEVSIVLDWDPELPNNLHELWEYCEHYAKEVKKLEKRILPVERL